MNCKISLEIVPIGIFYSDLFNRRLGIPPKGGVKVREFLPKFLLHNSGLGRMVAICPGYTKLD